MHTLFIPSWYPTHPSDIYGSFFREQALALRRAGLAMGVLTPSMRSLSNGLGAFRGPFGPREEDDEGMPTMRVHGVRALSWHHGLNMRFWETTGLRAFERYVQRHGRPDLLHVHGMIFGLAWAHAIYRKHRIPFVVTEHSSEFALGHISPDRAEYLTRALSLADRCFAVSSALGARLSIMFPRERTGQTWDVMPNLVSTRFGHATVRSRGSDADTFTFLNVAALHRNKGQHYLLDALAQAGRNEGGQLLRLRIAGTGPEAATLQAQTRQLDLQDKVTFLGHLSRERVAEEMSECDALVLSSSYETFGVVAVEALMSGRPVVGTRCGGPEDIVQEGDGWLVRPDDPAALAQGLLKMRAEQPNLDPEAIRGRCIERFGEEAFARRHVALYADVLARNLRPITQ